jgi:hypothetical protein
MKMKILKMKNGTKKKTSKKKNGKIIADSEHSCVLSLPEFGLFWFFLF